MTCRANCRTDGRPDGRTERRPGPERSNGGASRPSASVSRLELGAVYHHVGKSGWGGRGRARKSGDQTNEEREFRPPPTPPPRADCKLSLFCGGVLRAPSFLPSAFRLLFLTS